MKNNFFEKKFACPQCKTQLTPNGLSGRCTQCKFAYKKEDGIWHFLSISNKQSEVSRKQYNTMHKKEFGGPTDGSYEILARIARGNKTIDIACGEGIIEELSPQTVGVEFSLNALLKAKAKGRKNLVLADAHALPFRDNTFDVSISSGNLEHFTDPQMAIDEMARVSKIQVLTVHKHPPIPFSHIAHKVVTRLFNVEHQPIEQPIDTHDVVRMLEKSGLHIIFKGVWTLPLNYGKVIKFLPELKNIPSCSFFISIKNNG